MNRDGVVEDGFKKGWVGSGDTAEGSVGDEVLSVLHRGTQQASQGIFHLT